MLGIRIWLKAILLYDLLYLFARLRTDVGFLIDNTGNGADAITGKTGNIFDRDRLDHPLSLSARSGNLFGNVTGNVSNLPIIILPRQNTVKEAFLTNFFVQIALSW